jgi:hypothetical protein
MEAVGLVYGHVVHFTVFGYISWTFGIACGNLVYIFLFGILYKEKSGNPGPDELGRTLGKIPISLGTYNGRDSNPCLCNVRTHCRR